MKLLLFLAAMVGQAGLDASATAREAQTTPVEVMVYSDFQCPFCAQFAEALRELQTNGIDGVPTHVEFRHFPLAMHPRARLAHRAALAARRQDQFWGMHDLLFAHQSAATRDDVLRYAAMLKLDMERFRADLDDERFESDIDADVADGASRGVTATPTFFINSTRYAGTRPWPELKRLVEDEFRLMRALAEVTPAMMAKGPAGAPVTVELFADLQSPVTSPVIAAMDAAMARYPGALRLQFRHFPLSFHPQAALAHEAAMIAAKTGHFWAFADFILTHQESLREQDLIVYAGTLGLDARAFAVTLRERRYAPLVAADLKAGSERGVRGSPVLLVNGQQIDGVPSVQVLADAIETALAKVQAEQRGGPQP